MTRKIEYIAIARRWFDKVNGNTYHSVRIIRNSDGLTIYAPFQYGYGSQYQQSALEAMMKAGWIPEKYHAKAGFNSTEYLWERENDYPVHWEVIDGLKRDCVSNGRKY